MTGHLDRHRRWRCQQDLRPPIQPDYFREEQQINKTLWKLLPWLRAVTDPEVVEKENHDSEKG